MPRFNFSRLCHLIDCLKHIVCSSLRCIFAVHRALIGSFPFTRGLPKDRGSTRNELEISKKLPERDLIEVVEEQSVHGAVAVERPAEPVVEQPEYRPSEEDDDEFDSVKYRVETTDDFYCDYDSSWEIEEPQEGPLLNSTWRPPAHTSDAKPNLNFYLGHRGTLPDGVYISTFHNDWFRSYDKLEYVHTYIQWLFPLPEPGMNYEATPLTKEEITEFCKSSTAKENLLKSYKLMLDFYGIKLCDETTGEVGRAANWSERFFNLNSNTHNNLRITRILKCLGILGFPHYQAPLVHFFLKETIIDGKLPRVKESVLNYFLFAVRDKRQRRSLIKFAFKNFICKDEFVWCPKKIQLMWSGQSDSEQSKSQKGMNRMYESEQ
ncbi:opioid growth factor receptor-like [Tautogolabrus adspersus]